MPTKKPPSDPNKAAKALIDRLTASDGKNPAAVELGRKGGLKGGKARAEALSPKQRSDIAKKAAKKRWEDN